jgi:hypothetical protein
MRKSCLTVLDWTISTDMKKICLLKMDRSKVGWLDGWMDGWM